MDFSTNQYSNDFVLLAYPTDRAHQNYISLVINFTRTQWFLLLFSIHLIFSSDAAIALLSWRWDSWQCG